MNNIITINIGSRSKKYAYFQNRDLISNKEFSVEEKDSFQKFLDQNNLNQKEFKIAMRIVAPGRFFVEHKKIDSEYLKKLKEVSSLSPIHSKLVLAELEYITNKFEKIDIFGISDSVFHKNMPEFAKIYAIPQNLREEYGIERQGYHGLSLSSVIINLKKEMDQIPEKIVVCHLGGGSSVTALRNGVSVDTSMGWTVLEGLPMTERVGDIDPGALAFLTDRLKKTGSEMEEFLNTECGLEAISGIQGGNIPDILEATKNGDPRASLALKFYVYKIKKYIGAMSAILGGIHMLVFTGTVGLRSTDIREMILKDLDYLRFETKIVPIDEMLEMAKIMETI